MTLSTKEHLIFKTRGKIANNYSLGVGEKMFSCSEWQLQSILQGTLKCELLDKHVLLVYKTR